MGQECRHILASGEKCKALAMKEKPYCYFHARAHGLSAGAPNPAEGTLRFPVLEDQASIRLAIAQVIEAVNSGRLDPRRAGLILYGIQIAARTVPSKGSPLPKTPVVQVTQTDSGEDLAPAKNLCDIPHDCATCNQRNDCPGLRFHVLLTEVRPRREIEQLSFNVDAGATPCSSESQPR